jgi:hypothetical protein
MAKIKSIAVTVAPDPIRLSERYARKLLSWKRRKWMEYEDRLRMIWKIAAFAAGLTAAIHGGARLMGYNMVKKEPDIQWMSKPLDVVVDAQGRPAEYIIIGVDAKGFAHLGHAPLPQGQPQAQELPKVLPQAAVKPKAAQRKK